MTNWEPVFEGLDDEVNTHEMRLADLTGLEAAERMWEGLNAGENSLERPLSVPLSRGGDETGVTGGEIDSDRYQSEVVGEESVGGQTPTPDQNVPEWLEASVGLDCPDERPIRTQERLQSRDAHRWELNPQSSEDYQERFPK